MRERAAGVLLHPTALPGPGGIGSFGAEAHAFVEWLADAEQRYWQLLPLVAVDDGGSPYNALSAMAGNPLLIDLRDVARDGLIDATDLPHEQGDGGDARVDYPAVSARHGRALADAYLAFVDGGAPRMEAAFGEYRRRNAPWLDDYALFRALRERHGGAAWTAWPPELRDREARALAAAREELATEIGTHAFAQFLFDRQWSALRDRARVAGIRVIGDIPIFVAHDSSDVWANREIFELDPEGRPLAVSGVPPDYFSETGQRWGNPLYDWARLRERGYDWWIARFRRTMQWVDLVRVDHFRGFAAFWEIPAHEATAVVGRWRKGPGRDLFDALREAMGEVPVIAEDLGLITPDVEALRDELGLPGMRVLHFAFDGDPANPHLPENYPENVVGYTGTHDNDTTAGWWRSAPEADRRRAAERIGDDADPPVWPLIEMVFRSRAALAIVPVQDLLELGSESRMNVPGTTRSNWSWRLPSGSLTDAVGARLRRITTETGRAARSTAATGDDHSRRGLS